MGTEKSFSLFQRWICILPSYCCFLLCLHNEQAGSEQRRPENSGLPSWLFYKWHLRTQCVVECGNGKKVEMECPDEWININGSTATCGKKPACFPFCDKEGQPLKG